MFNWLNNLFFKKTTINWTKDSQEEILSKINRMSLDELNAKDKNGHTPLMFAACLGNADAIIALKKRGVDLNIQNEHGDIALDYATDPQIQNLLMPHKHISIHWGIDTPQEIIDKVRQMTPEQINEHDEDGNTLLMHAVSGNNYDVVQAFLIAKALIHKKNRHGLTAKDYAKDTKILKLLQQYEHQKGHF